MLYFGNTGKESTELINYFESNGAAKCPPEANAAEWILNATAILPFSTSPQVADTGTSEHPDIGPAHQPHEGWAQTWRQSPQRQEVSKELLSLEGKHSSEGLVINHYQGTAWMVQFRVVLKRVLQEHWRNPGYITAKFILSTLLVCLLPSHIPVPNANIPS